MSASEAAMGGDGRSDGALAVPRAWAPRRRTMGPGSRPKAASVRCDQRTRSSDKACQVPPMRGVTLGPMMKSRLAMIFL
jgi:hypothetical protein